MTTEIRAAASISIWPVRPHLLAVIDTTPLQQPGQQRQPNAVPEDHGAIGQRVHPIFKPPHALDKFCKGIGVLSQTPMQIQFIPIRLDVRFALRAIEAFDQRRVNDRELIQVVVNPRADVEAFAVGVPSFFLPKVTVGFADNHRVRLGFS